MDKELLYWLVVPITLCITGILQIKLPPKKINSFWGYRTRRSSASINAWNFAQVISGKYFVVSSIVSLILTIALIILTKANVFSNDMTIWVMLLQLFSLFLVVPYTESKLKKRFEEQ